VEVREGASAAAGTIVLAQGGAVTGVALDETGVPVRAADVLLRPTPARAEDELTAEKRAFSGGRTWTDEEGRFSFAAVHPGSYQVSVSRNDAEGAFASFGDHQRSLTPVEVSDGRTTDVCIQIRRQ
jgi:hypothetical protein